MTDTDGDKSFEKVLASFLRDDLAPAGPSCLAPGVVAAYCAAALSEAEARSAEAHLAGCAACQAEIALFARLEASGTAEPEAPSPLPRVAGLQDPVTATSPEARQPSQKHTSDSTTPTAESRPAAPIVLREAEPPSERAATQADEVPESVRHTAGWFPRRRRARWTWMGAAGLSAAAVLAITLTRHFRPLIDEASRRASDADSAPAAMRTESAVSKDAEEHAALPEPPEAQPAPTAAPFYADEVPADKAVMANQSAPAPAAGALASAPAASQAPARAAPAPPPPMTLATGRPAGRKTVVAQAQQPLSKAEKEDVPRAVAPPTAAPTATARVAQAAAAVRPVVVVARSNLDVLWRLTGTEIERSNDAGTTWNRQSATAGSPLLAGSAPTDEVCWAAGANGTLLRTSDGQHWERLSSPTDADIVQVTAWSVSTANIRTATGERFSTEDGAQTWSKL